MLREPGESLFLGCHVCVQRSVMNPAAEIPSRARTWKDRWSTFRVVNALFAVFPAALPDAPAALPVVVPVGVSGMAAGDDGTPESLLPGVVPGGGTTDDDAIVEGAEGTADETDGGTEGVPLVVPEVEPLTREPVPHGTAWPFGCVALGGGVV